MADKKAETVEVAEVERPQEGPGKARFIVNGQVVDAEGKVVEGLSVGKDGSITGKEKTAESK